MENPSTAKLAGIVLVAAFWLPQQLIAQNTILPAEQPAQTDRTPPAGNQQTPQQNPPASGTSVNPSQAPLQPVTTYPDASGNQQQQPTTAGPPQAPQPKQQPTTQQTEPQGAATAERLPTAGGSAAKPAGMAIAPAKQHRTRSLLIKFGALAAAGVAAGTIYALSRGTSSTPPGAGTPGAVPK